MSKLVFFIETNTAVVGSQATMLDLAAYIADNSKHEVYYVNNCHTDDLARHANTKLNFETLESYDYSDANDTIFFTPVNYAMHLIAKIKDYPDAKICHYVYSPNAISWLVGNIGKKSCDKIIRDILNESNACAYLNHNCVFPQVKFSDYEDEIFLPLALAEEYEEIEAINEIVDSEEINIAFYNSIGITATNVLQNLFNNIAIAKIDKPINIHIIGTVPAFPGLDFKICSSAMTRLIFTGKMRKEDSIEYIRNNVDIVVSYEEKAIESGVFGVPVVLPVTSEKPFAGNNFVYLFDANRFVYSWTNETLLLLNNTCYKFDKILSDVYNQKQKGQLAKKCMEYCKKNNSLEVASENFLTLVKKSQLYVRDYLAVDGVQEVMDKFDAYCEENEEKQFSDFLRNRKK